MAYKPKNYVSQTVRQSVSLPVCLSSRESISQSVLSVSLSVGLTLSKSGSQLSFNQSVSLSFRGLFFRINLP